MTAGTSGAPSADATGAARARIADVTVVLVNYRTLELTRQALTTLFREYPGIATIVVDNGSDDASTRYLEQLAAERDHVRLLLNAENRHHGPALDQAVRAARSPYVFALDSDCEVRRGGFLEAMLDVLAQPGTYAVGELRLKSRWGYTFGYGDADTPARRLAVRYVHPYAMLLDRRLYESLAPFELHGAPCLANMRSAQRAGLRVVDFPIDEYVEHLGEGTSAHQGYGFFEERAQFVRLWLDRIAGRLTGERTLDVVLHGARRDDGAEG